MRCVWIAVAGVAACTGVRDGTAVFDPLTRLPDAAGYAGADAVVFAPADAGPDGAAGPRTLVINEVAPAGAPTDWVELLNLGEATVSLDGWGLADALGGSVAPFAPGLSVGPGARQMVEITDAAFGFKLGSDEALVLVGPGGDVVDQADWDEGAAPEGRTWGRLPDGTGPFETLSPTPGAPNAAVEGTAVCGNGVIDSGEACDGPALGEAVCPNGGAPVCAADCTIDSSGCTILPTVAVVLNEVDATSDRIELFNRGGTVADLGGWTVTDADYLPTRDPAHRYTVPQGTLLAPGAYLVLEPGVAHPFGLGKTDALTLSTPDGVAFDETSWGEPDAETSWCRLPNGAGAFTACPAATWGGPNVSTIPVVCGDGVRAGAELCDEGDVGAASCEGQGLGPGTLGCAAGCAAYDTAACGPVGKVVINEVSSAGDDAIELLNVGTTAVDLTAWRLVDSGWVQDDAASHDGHELVFDGAAATFLPGERRVLIKGTDHPFGLGKADGVRLIDSDGEIRDATAWPDGAAETSWCRVPDGDGAFTDCTDTFGAPNTP